MVQGNQTRVLKKAASIMLALSLLLSMVVTGNVVSMTASADGELTDGNYAYVVLSDGTAKITKYSGAETDLVIPASLGGVNVSAIGSEAFKDNDAIERVTISDGIQTIGSYAFMQCDGIESINFAPSVTTIGGYAFQQCRGLQSVDIPATVKTLGDRVFYNCPILETVTLHEGLETMGFRFLSGTAVASIYIPTTVTKATESFAEAERLTSVTFGNGITSIPNDMFEDNHSLRAITIPATVTKLGNDAFSEMYALESIVIPDTVTEWGTYAFYKCVNLTSVTIGSGVTTIPNSAFAECTRLTSIEIPSTIKAIGSNSFGNCTRLTNITLNEGLENIGSYSFANTAVADITLPASVTAGEYPFNNCADLRTVRFSEGCNMLVQGLYQNSGVESVVIPEGITVLPWQLFSGCKRLTNVQLPSTLKTIKGYAFSGCTALTSIDIPKGVRTIEGRAFEGTTALTTCTFHEGLQTLGNQLFVNSGLTSIYIPKTLSATNSPFEFSNITDVTFGDGITTLTNDLFYNAKKLTHVTLPNTLTLIGSYCFAQSTLESVVIPDSVQTMGGHAFSHCDNLYAVKIGTGLRSLPSECFIGCDLLQNVIIPETIVDMGNSVFAETGLTYQKLPQSLLVIPYGTFKNCTALTEVKCSDNLESIGEQAFNGCTNFTTLTTAARSPRFNTTSFDNCPKFFDKRFDVFNRSNTGIESTGNVGIDDTLIHFTVTYDIRDDWADSDLSMRALYLNLPNNLDIVTTSFTAEGFDFDNAAYTGDYKSIPLTNGKSSGKLRFSAYLNGSEDALKNMSAEVEFYYKGTRFQKPVGDVEIVTAKLSLFAPSTITKNTMVVSGYTATPNKDVTIYISRLNGDGTKEDPVSYTVTPNQYTGKYISDELPILVPGKTAVNEDEFEVYAATNGVQSDVVNFTYLPGAVSVTKAYEDVNIRKFVSPYQTDNFVEGTNATHYDITGIFTKGTSPVVVINPALMVRFAFQLENDENISDMVLMSHKGNDWKFMRLYYDAATDMWIGEGYFNNASHELISGYNYVPGALNLFYYYGEREDTYRSHFYGSASSGGSVSNPVMPKGDLWGDLIGQNDDEDPFYYDKDGKPHGTIGDYHETIGGAVKDVFIDIITGDWKNVPADITVGGLKALWEWGNTDDNLFKGLHHGYTIGPDGAIVFPGDDKGDMLNHDAGKDGKQRNAIDPSGYVYEAVEGNRVEGATMTIYKLNEDSGEWEEWNAADFEQQNPIQTNNEGAYAWFTDEGRFKVTVSKDGYETQTSEEFDIPPEKLDLNFGLVDNTTHPTATVTKEAFGKYTLQFSKFMDPATVTTDTITLDGLTNVAITPVYLSDGDAYADTFLVTGTPGGAEVTVTVTDGAQSYSGVAAEAASITVDGGLLGDFDGNGIVN
ncbi:MAG: leucine-rich repeat domain-containing protein, partial [Clostridia bacterium]|nr:leucine-rich repeat domain-containing protein [Clostridia bacterium]